MSNELNKPREAQELTEKELEGVVGGLKVNGAGIVVLDVPGGGAALADSGRRHDGVFGPAYAV